jgi:flagellar assembly protein FliH
MIWSSAKPAFHAARDIDELIAAEWDLEELLTRPAAPHAPAAAEEQDALIEAIAIANAQREQEEAAERERLIAEAYAVGFEEGRREGEEAEGARLRNAVTAAEASLDELRAGEERWIGTIEENVCALAVAVARQIIGRELQGDVDAVTDLVRRAVAEFPIDQPIRIRVNPGDLAVLSTAIGVDGQPIQIASGRDARWLADALITPGGCVVEGRDRIIDGRVDTALERVYRRLTYTNA